MKNSHFFCHVTLCMRVCMYVCGITLDVLINLLASYTHPWILVTKREIVKKFWIGICTQKHTRKKMEMTMIEHFKHDLTLLNNYYDCYLAISKAQKNKQTKTNVIKESHLTQIWCIDSMATEQVCVCVLFILFCSEYLCGFHVIIIWMILQFLFY